MREADSFASPEFNLTSDLSCVFGRIDNIPVPVDAVVCPYKEDFGNPNISLEGQLLAYAYGKESFIQAQEARDRYEEETGGGILPGYSVVTPFETKKDAAPKAIIHTNIPRLKDLRMAVGNCLEEASNYPDIRTVAIPLGDVNPQTLRHKIEQIIGGVKDFFETRREYGIPINIKKVLMFINADDTPKNREVVKNMIADFYPKY
jgi:hypothetical protein